MNIPSDDTITIVRPHWLMRVSLWFVYVLSLVVPFLWWRAVSSSGLFTTFNPEISWRFYIGYVVLVSVIVLVLARIFSNNRALITDNQVVVIKKGFQKIQALAMQIGDIEKTIVTYPSPFARLFGIGDLRVAGAQGALSMHFISRPEYIAQHVLEKAQAIQPAQVTELEPLQQVVTMVESSQPVQPWIVADVSEPVPAIEAFDEAIELQEDVIVYL